MNNAAPLFRNLCEVSTLNPAHGSMQMAIDEVLLRSCSTPTFRRYVWAEPQVTFGYFGDWQRVTGQYPCLRCTRRWTGGGIVEHGSDYTWSICIPPAEQLFHAKGVEIYSLLHERLRLALEGAGVMTNAAVGGPGGERCFVSPVRHDLLQSKKKVAGGALRRTKLGILYQGSVRIPKELHNTLHTILLRALGGTVEVTKLSASECSQAQLLEKQRYANPAWLQQRRGTSVESA